MVNMAQGWERKEEASTANKMNAHTHKGTHRVALVVDATGSMSFALEAIRDMLLNVVRLLRLVASGVVSHICLVVYRDYSDEPVTQSMTVHVDDDEGVHNMLQFIRATDATGGGDGPEAAKTAVWELMKALPQQGNGGGQTWVLWFANAPPHLAGQSSDNKAPEDRFLCDHAFPTDWLQICGLLKEQACMVCFPVHLSSGGSSKACFCEMARITGGHCFQMQRATSEATHDMAAFNLSLLSQLCGYSVDLPSSVADVLHAAENGPLPNSEEDLTRARCQGAIRNLGDASQVPSIGGTKTCRAADLVRMLHDTANPLLGRTLSEFERMLDDPASTMVLTVNELLGVLWRELCKKRFEGPQTCALKNRLSAAVSTMLAGSKRADGEVLQKFLQDSYDQTEAIHDMLGQAEERCGADTVGTGKVYLTLPHPPKMLTNSELLDLIRSCHTQEVVAAMFSGLVATTCKPSQQDQPYVPLFGLSDEDTFRLLPHLLCPGIMFETRGACILAAVCLTKSAGPRELRLKAEGLLRSKQGEQWSNAEAYPENRSGAFAALMCALRNAVDSGPEPTLLPAEGYHTYALALFTARLRTARHNPLDGIKTAKHAYGGGVHGRVRPDFGLRACASCGQARSLFALAKIGPVEGGACCCTLCTADDGVEEARQVPAAAGRFAQCHECDEHYFLQRPEVLKSVRTKFPSCRGRLPARSLSCACQGCGSTYQFAVAVSDTESTRELEHSLPEGISTHRFTCPTCHTKQQDPFDSHAIPLGEFLRSNGLPSGLGPSELTGSAAKAAVLLDSSGNPLSIVTQAAATAAEESGSRCPTLLCKESGSYQKALTIRNPPGELHDKVKAALEGPCFRLPCDLCAELHTPPALSSMCGHRTCRSCVCEGCKGRWFGQASPGTKCPLAVLHCAFCKRPPQAGVLARHNARLAQLAKNHRASIVPLSSLDPSHAYGWCIACDKLAPLERGGGCCAAEEEGTNTCEELRDFMCTACRDAVDESAVRGEQSCPNPACGIGIEKNGGCNHMTCTACGHHWCWLCRADFGNGVDSVVAAIDHMCGVDPDVREEEAEEDNDLI